MAICKVNSINQPSRMINYNKDNFHGLQNSLNICISARVTLSTNLWIDHGLVDSAVGIIRDFVFPINRTHNFLPTGVLIEFDYYTGTHKIHC